MDNTELQQAEVILPDEEVNNEELIHSPSPQMNVTVSDNTEGGDLVPDELLTTLWKECLDNCRSDRKECDHLLANFVEMVMNEGDATTASKEAICNIVKTKTDITDKMIKIADQLQTQKLKKPTQKVQAEQHNHFHLNRRSLLRELEMISKENKNK